MPHHNIVNTALVNIAVRPATTLALLATLSACLHIPRPPKTAQPEPAPAAAPTTNQAADSDESTGAPAARTEKKKPAVQTVVLASLQAQREDWRGVPYRYGGKSRKGVDCSGFVQLTFQSRLGIKVPRTTTALLETGKAVAKAELKVGDLVFFRTGPNNRHVGIYMGNGRFIHASSSKGVMESSLSNPYWQAHYWQARRIPVAPSALSAHTATETVQ